VPYCSDLTTVSKQRGFVTNDPQGKSVYDPQNLAGEMQFNITLDVMVTVTQAVNVMFTEG
jgi:hypothetical protein